jgi:hypothetical protein
VSDIGLYMNFDQTSVIQVHRSRHGYSNVFCFVVIHGAIVLC